MVTVLWLILAYLIIAWTMIRMNRSVKKTYNKLRSELENEKVLLTRLTVALEYKNNAQKEIMSLTTDWRDTIAALDNNREKQKYLDKLDVYLTTSIVYRDALEDICTKNKSK